MTFKIGMKVVCVDVEGFRDWLGCKTCTKPVLNGVYTVRAIFPRWTGRGKPAVLLEEISNPIVHWSDGDVTEVAFAAHRFRPAVSPKQQVSFTTGAPRDSRKWDNRRKRVEVVS